jgi:hypothetical protein
MFKKEPLRILFVILALIAAWYICRTIILPNIDARIEFENKTLSGQQEPPYQYRLLKPLIGKMMETAVFTILGDVRWAHVISYAFLSFLTFLGIFTTFHAYLSRDFSASTALIGTLLLMAVLPLSASGYYMEGDYITLLFYIAGLILIRQGKDAYLPAIIGIGALNREQIVFLLVWYLLHQKTLTGRRVFWALMGFTVWLAVFFGVRMYFGFKPSPYTSALHVANNTDLANLFILILPLWFSNVAGFVVMSLMAFRKSNLFYKYSLMSLTVYGVLFFFNGNMWELAKFLPAYLILIPMSLQTLTGEYIPETAPPTLPA